MREIFTLDSAFARLDSVRSSKGETLHPLSRRASESALLLLRLLCTAPGPLPGPEIHRLAASWLSDPSLSVTDLPSWMAEKGLRCSLSPGRMDEARKGVRASLDGGLWIVALENPPNPGGDIPRCPRFLLGRGTLSPEDSWIVFFNSRKPRSISRKARWLRFLRDSLNRLPAFGYGLATSVDTLTYDLAAAFARSRNIPLLLCLPFAHGSSGPVNGLPSISPTLPCRAALSCLPATVVCPKAVRMQCRDRILAILADVRVLLEIRRQGTLLEMLSIEQRHRPRPQLVMLPDSPTPSNEGNLEILKDFPSWSLPISPGEPTTPASRRTIRGTILRLNPRDIDWSRFLYHYTRSCPGPWPGQSSTDYFLSILEDHPLCEHTAMDTLVRILTEGRIRSGTRLVRGTDPVISWTSSPPGRLQFIRRWNPALIRWTFEPYGIAVCRRRLRKAGAKPAVYGPEEVYARLRESERYRYQLHAPPRQAWKQEREWRSQEDLNLSELSSDEFFLFFPRAEEALRLLEVRGRSVPVVVLDDDPYYREQPMSGRLARSVDPKSAFPQVDGNRGLTGSDSES